MDIMIYGAKALALSMCRALQKLYPEHPIRGFLVSSLKNNPTALAGLPVIELRDFSRRDVYILVATPEDIHGEIVEILKTHHFVQYTCMDSRKEAALMEQFYICTGDFLSLHTLEAGGVRPDLEVYLAKFYKDRILANACELPEWTRPLQAGAALTSERVARITDDTGENISSKNVNYCELTALYWLWKNRLCSPEGPEYCGLFQYRRVLDIRDQDLLRMKANDIDVVLSYPTMHEPDIREHHTRYVKESDWEAMLQAIREQQPEYEKAYEDIFSQPYFYNYNMIVAKRKVLSDYCAWLFAILERTEELSVPRGWERKDRYIGYLGENLMTLYFMYHKKDLNIAHVGRRMMT